MARRAVGGIGAWRMIDAYCHVEARGITKEFPGALALNDVSFGVRRGDVHALCGENGAGKSTLIGVLGGVWPVGSYDGELFVGGQAAAFRSVRDSQRAGVAIIHQELALVPDMTVEENIALGREKTRGGRVDRAWMRRECLALLERLRLDMDPATPVRELGVGHRQLVEIGKALARNADILALDEPTSALTDPETAALFDVLRELKAQGVTLIYISHRLDEALELSDRVTALRDGESVGTWDAGELDRATLVERMVGRKVAATVERRERAVGDVLLTVEDWTARDRSGQARVEGVSFEVRAGEVLGIAGMMGSGRTELLMSLFGAWEGAVEGRLSVAGGSVRFRRPGDAIRAGLALVTEDRKRDGLLLDSSVEANLTLASLRELSKRGMVDRDRARTRSASLVEALDIRTPRLATLARNLSGGNQQKTALGKWLMTEPRVLLLDEPTRGVDVGAKAEIHALIRRLAERGTAIVMVSSEWPELLSVSDRVLVMRDGRVAGRFDETASITAEAALSAAIGAA